MKIGVIGAGRWGCTLAHLVQTAGHKTIVFCLSSDIKRLNTHAVTDTRLSQLLESIELTLDKDKLTGCQLIFVAVPGKNLVDCNTQWELQKIEVPIVMAIKALYCGLGRDLVLPTDLLFRDYAYFACGAFPEGILNGSPAIGTVYCASRNLGEMVRDSLPIKLMRCYTSSDLKGGQIGAALKNVIAIACGIAYGMGFDEMTLAALISRGAREISRFACIRDAHAETFADGSSFLADLMGTAYSPHSHNRQAGILLASGVTRDQLEQSIGTVEGIHTVGALDILQWPYSHLPICKAVSEVLRGLPPKKAMENLLNRPLKDA